MVGIAAAIAARFPNSVVLKDWGVMSDGTSERIYLWDADAMSCLMPSETELAEWAVLPAPAPRPRWIEFGGAIQGSTQINQLLGTALQQAPALGLALGIGLGKAADGDARVFVSSWAIAGSLGMITDDLVAEATVLAEQFDLPPDFVAALQPS